MTILKIRIGISIVLGLAVIYTYFIVATFRKYGSAMDLKWTERIRKWRLNKAYNVAYPFHDSPNGSFGSPTAVTTPPRGESSRHSSPRKPQVHFRDDVSFISDDSSPALSPLELGIQTREVANTAANQGDAPGFVFEPYRADRQAAPARTRQELGLPLPLAHKTSQQPHDTSPSHTPDAGPSNMLPRIPIDTPSLLIPPPGQLQPARSSDSHSSEKGDPSEVAPIAALTPISVSGTHKAMFQAQEAEPSPLRRQTSNASMISQGSYLKFDPATYIDPAFWGPNPTSANQPPQVGDNYFAPRPPTPTSPNSGLSYVSQNS